MEQNSYSLPYKHISNVAKETIQYIKQRKNKELIPLKTKWKKFNYMCNGGIEPGCVYTIVGSSGTGKSTFLNCLQIDLIEENPQENIIVLSFSLEMIGYRQVGKILSNKLHQTTSSLYSAEETLDDTTLAETEIEIEKINKYPIYYVDEISTVDKVESTIKYFQETVAKDKWLVVLLDHTLLVDSQFNDERKTIAQLEKVFIKAKKIGKTSIIQLSQMNRNIEQPERIFNPAGHYPMRSDLSSSDSIFQASDIIAVLSRPELLGIREYGINKLPVQNKIYLHFLKVREGKLAILEYDNDLAYNNFIER